MKVEQSPSLKTQVEENLRLKDKGYLAPISHYSNKRNDLRKGDRHLHNAECAVCKKKLRIDRPHKKCSKKLEQN